MSEGNATALDLKRFHIDSESLNAMRALRDAITKIQVKRPYFSGLGFFGSRVKGTSRNESDLDVYIFENSEKFPLSYSRSASPHMASFSVLVGDLREKTDVLLHPWAIDISEKSTVKSLESFKKDVDMVLADNGGNLPDKVYIPIPNLVPQFHLAVGEEVYQNRRLILDRIGSWGNSEIYWKILMDELARQERGEDRSGKLKRDYTRYPQTVEEARRYFCLGREEGDTPIRDVSLSGGEINRGIILRAVNVLKAAIK